MKKIMTAMVAMVIALLPCILMAQLGSIDIDYGYHKIIGRLDLIHQKRDSSIYIGARNGGYADIPLGGANVYVGKDIAFARRASSFVGNVVMGYEAGRSLEGDFIESTIVGYQAGIGSKRGINNVFVGAKAGITNSSDQNVLIGAYSGANSSGSGNTYVGHASSPSTKGSYNTHIGSRTSGIAQDSFSRTIAIGYQAAVGCDNCAVIGGIGPNAVKLGLGTHLPTHTFSLRHPTENPVTSAGLQIANIDANQNSWELYTANAGGSLIFLENGNIVRSLKEDGTFMLGSDRRLKSDIQPIEGETMEKILALRPTSYTYNHQKQSTNRSLGFVAQELQKVFPEIVDVINPDAPLDEQRLGVSYESLIPILVKGMQEQQASMRKQERKINQLLERIEQLEKKQQ